MFVVMLSKGGAVVDLKEFGDWRAAKSDYNRQARNAWRRKSAYNQVQFHQVAAYSDTVEFMTWRTPEGSWSLDLLIVTPDWIKAVRGGK